MDSLAGPSSEQALEGPLSRECGFLEPLHPRNNKAWGPTPLYLLITHSGARRAAASHLSKLVFLLDSPGCPPKSLVIAFSLAL